MPVEVPGRKGRATLDRDGRGAARRYDRRGAGELQPAFTPSGTVTAGNAPGFTDGAAALSSLAQRRVQAHGLQPMARVLGYASAATDPLWLFEAPELALRKLFDKTGTTLDDWDLLEINEAFAAQIVANGKALDWDWDRVNVNGGAIALGHPLGATGARLVVTLLHALQAARQVARHRRAVPRRRRRRGHGLRAGMSPWRRPPTSRRRPPIAGRTT